MQALASFRNDCSMGKQTGTKSSLTAASGNDNDEDFHAVPQVFAANSARSPHKGRACSLHKAEQ